MKKYVKSGTAVDIYKDVTIYDDGEFYIYTEPHGQGRLELASIHEAKEYIDEIAESELTPISNNKARYRIDYYNSVKRYDYTYVDAYSESEAKLIAQKVLGNEIWKIDRVVKIIDEVV